MVVIVLLGKMLVSVLIESCVDMTVISLETVATAVDTSVAVGPLTSCVGPGAVLISVVVCSRV